MIRPVEMALRSRLTSTFSALRYRDFRLFWIALTISLLGVSFQTVAQGWLVYRITDSPFMLGLTGFIPAVLSAPASLVGGMVADRVSRRKLVIVTQAMMTFPPVVLAYLIWVQTVQAWHVIAATAVLGIVAAFDIPSRTAMVPQLVPEDELLNAQGLASAVGQVSRIAGPALAGLIIARWGEAIPYFINGLTYLAMVVALLMMKPQPAPEREGSEGLRAGLLGGIRYMLGSPIVLGLFAIVAAQGLFLSSYITLLPVFASDILAVGAEGLGWLSAAVGTGALAGALIVANLRPGRRGWILSNGTFVLPVVLIGFAWSGIFGVSLPLLFLLGFGTVLIRTITATFLLTIVPDHVRGRVISLATMIFYGAPYIGGLPTGYLAEQWNASGVLTIAGGVFLLIIIFVNFRIPDIRRHE